MDWEHQPRVLEGGGEGERDVDGEGVGSCKQPVKPDLALGRLVRVHLLLLGGVLQRGRGIGG